MADEQKVIYYEWPGGMKSVAGGTRTKINLSRPWQKEIEVKQEGCPFCDPKDPARLLHFEKGGGWWLRKNIFTPYSFHQMVVPERCWESDKLRALGGKEEINTALAIALGVAEGAGVPGIYLNVHIGALAGQNLPHLHWHIVRYSLDEESDNAALAREWHDLYFDSERPWNVKRPDLVVYQNSFFAVVVGGVKAGQCFIVRLPKILSPVMQEVLWSEYGDPDRYFFADALDKVISLYNEKFLSRQGIKPDFNVAVVLGKYGDILYAQYTPILNHWGSAEQVALYTKCPITLPWPHEMTAAYLRGEISV